MLLAAILFAHFVVAGYSGIQRYDPRERFTVPSSVLMTQRTMRSRMKNQIVPGCPEIAKQRGIHDKVTLSLNVDEKGHVTGAEIISGNPVFEDAAIEAGKRLRFRPYFLGGEAVPTRGRITYGFRCFRTGEAVSLAPMQ